MNNKKIFMTLVLVFILLTMLASCKEKSTSIDSYFDGDIPNINQLQLPEEGEEIAIINTTKGTMKMRLFPEAAPMAVENFKTLVQEGFYEGYEFSRIKENFCIQIGTSVEYPDGKSIYGEFYDNETSSEYHHFFGAVGLAKKRGKKNSSVFYILARENLIDEDIEFLKNNSTNLNEEEIYAFKTIGGVPRCDYLYTLFGQVYEGLDVLLEISKTPISETTFEPLEKTFINEIIIEKVEK